MSLSEINEYFVPYARTVLWLSLAANQYWTMRVVQNMVANAAQNRTLCVTGSPRSQHYHTCFLLCCLLNYCIANFFVENSPEAA